MKVKHTVEQFPGCTIPMVNITMLSRTTKIFEKKKSRTAQERSFSSHSHKRDLADVQFTEGTEHNSAGWGIMVVGTAGAPSRGG